VTNTHTHSHTDDRTRPAAVGRLQWRVVDIVVAAVLGVACGLVFFGWNSIGYAGFQAIDALTPGLGGLAAGVWFLAGPLGALIIRKPGAALMVELMAGFVSMSLGNQWGWTTMYSAFAQGLGAELIFLIFAYRRFGVVIAALAGIGAGLGAWVNEFILGNWEKTIAFNTIYLVTLAISGAVLAGLLSWLLTRALARAGALERFAAGREAGRTV
jgi:energy-coupling factor transport system substrate-specific component